MTPAEKKRLTRRFQRALGADAMVAILEWAGDNLAPNEVFDPEALVRYVRGDYRPEEVYCETELRIWAEENGYLSPEQQRKRAGRQGRRIVDALVKQLKGSLHYEELIDALSAAAKAAIEQS